MTLPNADRAFLDIRKLRDYALSVDDDRGKHKATVFRSALGIGADDAEWLRTRILEGVRTAHAVRKRRTAYGVLYEVDLPIQTDSGSAVVRTGWIVHTHETFPRLTTCYVL
ncbi:DUF6883 domain-containing protein [Rubrivirga sp.]|uniref:DUF6883 domain-containing protein n=1 Tax=Rubrivirga sp. TaxID=1885344 RepID=UPI003B517EAF